MSLVALLTSIRNESDVNGPQLVGSLLPVQHFNQVAEIVCPQDLTVLGQ